LVSPHLSDADGLHNDVSIIYHYISVLPASLSYTFYIPSSIVYFFVSFFNRSFPSVCTSCVGLLSLHMRIHFARGLDWTGLDWTGLSPLLVMVLLVVSCYKLSCLLKLLPICSLPLFCLLFLHIYIIYSYVRRTTSSMFSCARSGSGTIVNKGHSSHSLSTLYFVTFRPI